MSYVTRVSAAALLIPALMLTACTNGSDTSTPQPSDTSTQTANTPASASPDAQGPSGPVENVDENEAKTLLPINGTEWVTALEPATPVTGEDPMVFSGLRASEHLGFYRVVVEFSGKGQPGYFQNWSATPVEQGRGEPLDVEGTVFLDLMISGTAMPVGDTLAQHAYNGPKTLSVGPIQVIEDGTFEDTTHIVIGMDKKREFQIGFLKEPTRVVIDIRN